MRAVPLPSLPSLPSLSCVPSLSLVATLLVSTALLGPVSAQAAPGDYGEFSTACEFSHASSDDPIVHPGHEGAAHRHHFFGNTSTNADSTTQSLRNAETNCDRTNDTAAYWVPALYDRGVELEYEAVHVYYRNINVRDDSVIVAFPAGLRMVAGTDAHPDSPDGQRRVAEWRCADAPTGQAGTVDIPATCHGGKLIGVVTFPSCWDGVNLTTDDQSHMLYPWQNSENPRQCPASHPVTLPELTEHFRYDPISTDLTGITLSSGPPSTLHADFWNAWKQKSLERLVDKCLIGGIDCGTVGDLHDS